VKLISSPRSSTNGKFPLRLSPGLEQSASQFMLLVADFWPRRPEFVPQVRHCGICGKKIGTWSCFSPSFFPFCQYNFIGSSYPLYIWGWKKVPLETYFHRDIFSPPRNNNYDKVWHMDCLAETFTTLDIRTIEVRYPAEARGFFL